MWDINKIVKTILYIVELDKSVETVTLRELLTIAHKELGPEAVLEFSGDIIYQVYCKKCKTTTDVFYSLGKLKQAEMKCPICQQIMDFELTQQITGNEKFIDKTLAEIGIPPFDIINSRIGLENKIQYEFTKDKNKVLGKIF